MPEFDQEYRFGNFKTMLSQREQARLLMLKAKEATENRITAEKRKAAERARKFK